MCGIAGVVNFDQQPVARDLLDRMNAAQLHRGPDDGGILLDANVGLAHRRLSIIDLSAAGHQPMDNEDGSITIIFNGEIYNSPALRRDLEQSGHIFKTHTDTEVILHLYEELGEKVGTMLNGMFAFAIYDRRRRRLLLVRDRLGKKPLLYFIDHERMAFASEMAALQEHPQLPRQLNLQALSDYFSLLYIPSPQTIYNGVHKLPPGCYLDIDCYSGNFRLEPYWQIDYRRKTELKFADAQLRLRELLTDAVKIRLLADVPLGAFLSGGIDSTVIAGLMSAVSGAPVQTFTVGFAETRYDEREFARAAVTHLNARGGQPLVHHEKMVDPDDFDTLVMLARHYGEPFADASMLPTCLLSRFTREQVTVALSGDGADELFAGYNRYLLMRLLRNADLTPAWLRHVTARSLARLLPPKLDERSRVGKLHRLLDIVAARNNHRYLQIIDRFGEDLKHRLCGDAFPASGLAPTQDYFDNLLETATAADPVEKIMETDLHSYLVGDILCKVDIAAMANSLEVRNPFLDYRVVEFAASLPLSYKQSGRRRKHILVETFQELLPPPLSRRGKLGFGVPLAAWFRGGWHERLQERLLDGEAVKLQLLRRAETEKIIAQHYAGKQDYSYPLFTLLMLELFLEECHPTRA